MPACHPRAKTTEPMQPLPPRTAWFAKRRAALLVAFAVASIFPARAVAQSNDFPLVRAGAAAPIVFSAGDAKVADVASLDFKDGGAEWAQGVLNATRTVSATLHVPSPGAHTLRIYGVDAGVVLDKIVIDCGGLQPSYLGPPEAN
jgi:hypothetical protein